MIELWKFQPFTYDAKLPFSNIPAAFTLDCDGHHLDNGCEEILDGEFQVKNQERLSCLKSVNLFYFLLLFILKNLLKLSMLQKSEEFS